ncbi:MULTISPECIES: lytic transglycosylase domain-containing protein [unclassified Bartonella]|uniref:lytic transglycosylase domain-containing protein n=1 Tax=unclassified Bartonella TaxID=2645622 RepID=UPI0015FE66AA|nr:MULTISPECIES: transglycosylase SLT domain-containing protein [unclassified Bartonella]UXN05200.1 transglycosylase SLT domain-containing protein [Bartonella sp. HY761]
MKIISFITLLITFFAASFQIANAVPKIDKKIERTQKLDKSKAQNNDESRPYEDIIKRHAAANNVPVDMAHAVVKTESNYNKNARGRAGEIGLMQIKLSTARSLGYRGSAKALYDPQTNIEYGMKYLGLAHQLSGGNMCNTILKYNAGHAAKRMNPVSARYCSKVKSYLASLN